jgi:hypothetical protein
MPCWTSADGGAPSPHPAVSSSITTGRPARRRVALRWIVQIESAVLDGVELVTWHGPGAEGRGELVADRQGRSAVRRRPGGWFGVSADVHFKDGTAETINRRVDLPEPS